MNVFNDNNTNNLVTNEVDAWFGILYSCISADKQITANETKILTRIIHSKQKFIGVDLLPLFFKSSELKKQLGHSTFISACCERIEEEDKNMLFALALEVLLADGILEKEEKNLIEIISDALKIDPKMSSKIIEVIFLKNKGNVKGI
ncbi:TerB family tellurite resistance protein [Flavobacterium sp. XS1P32]|uniref:tellurite resistance TerB family protein n=1 Tax=Flavobacterium sp. XS1P32 TaxID=3401726 RepID=UPI003AB0E1B3